jgi:hypothetical protein
MAKRGPPTKRATPAEPSLSLGSAIGARHPTIEDELHFLFCACVACPALWADLPPALRGALEGIFEGGDTHPNEFLRRLRAVYAAQLSPEVHDLVSGIARHLVMKPVRQPMTGVQYWRTLRPRERNCTEDNPAHRFVRWLLQHLDRGAPVNLHRKLHPSRRGPAFELIQIKSLCDLTQLSELADAARWTAEPRAKRPCRERRVRSPSLLE